MSERTRNPRGQGERLREDIVAAASAMLADPAAPPLTLRGVARAVGVAATSVYLHFDDVESLVLEVARRGFDELRAAQDAAMDAVTGPCERLRAGSLAYCDWALANPGHYQWMFTNPLRISASAWDELPGRAGVRGAGRDGGRVPRAPGGRPRVRADRAAAVASAARNGQPAHSAAIPAVAADPGNRRRSSHPARHADAGAGSCVRRPCRSNLR